ILSKIWNILQDCFVPPNVEKKPKQTLQWDVRKLCLLRSLLKQGTFSVLNISKLPSVTVQLVTQLFKKLQPEKQLSSNEGSIKRVSVDVTHAPIDASLVQMDLIFPSRIPSSLLHTSSHEKLLSCGFKIQPTKPLLPTSLLGKVGSYLHEQEVLQSQLVSSEFLQDEYLSMALQVHRDALATKYVKLMWEKSKGNSFQFPSLLKPLQMGIHELNCTGLSVTPFFFQKLQQHFPNLQSLDISGTTLTKECTQEIAKFTSLKKLTLQNCKMDDVGLVPLKNCTKLEELDLSNTEITGISFAYLPE